MRQPDSRESYEVFAGRLHWIAAIIVLSFGAIVWLMYLLAHTWLAPLPAPPSLPLPVPPRLQANPHSDLQAVTRREHAAIEEYRWADPQRGIAHIPIERAMDLLAQPPVPSNNANPREPQAATAKMLPGAAALHAPADLRSRVGLEQHLGSSLPANLTFRDTDGAPVTLRRLANSRPLLVALGYYDCPNLCDTELRGIGHAVGSIALQPGTDFQVAFVSIDPRETSQQASLAARTLTRDLPSAAVPRWHLLTGDETNIRQLAAALGYRYWFDARNAQYAHPAGIVIITAGGRIAQYFFGVSFPADALRLALVGASQGQLGTVLDQLVLLCCGYDPTTGRYSLLIGRITLILCCAFLVVAGLWVRMTIVRRRRHT